MTKVFVDPIRRISMKTDSCGGVIEKQITRLVVSQSVYLSLSLSYVPKTFLSFSLSISLSLYVSLSFIHHPVSLFFSFIQYHLSLSLLLILPTLFSLCLSLYWFLFLSMSHSLSYITQFLSFSLSYNIISHSLSFLYYQRSSLCVFLSIDFSFYQCLTLFLTSPSFSLFLFHTISSLTLFLPFFHSLN